MEAVVMRMCGLEVSQTLLINLYFLSTKGRNKRHAFLFKGLCLQYSTNPRTEKAFQHPRKFRLILKKIDPSIGDTFDCCLNYFRKV